MHHAKIKTKTRRFPLNFMFLVGVILDSTWRSTCTRDVGCDVIVDFGYTTRQITSHFTARFRLESGRRLSIYLLHVSTLPTSKALFLSVPILLFFCLTFCTSKWLHYDNRERTSVKHSSHSISSVRVVVTWHLRIRFICYDHLNEQVIDPSLLVRCAICD